LKVDESQAQRENLRMRKLAEEEIMQYQMEAEQNPEVDELTGEPLAAGPLVPVNTWDNHAVHIEVHNRFRKTQAFEMLPEIIKAEFEQHVSMHAQSMIVGQQGNSADMGMMPTPEELGEEVAGEGGGEEGGPANQFGPSDASQPPLPGMEQ
jgi:hypothetical protein